MPNPCSRPASRIAPRQPEVEDAWLTEGVDEVGVGGDVRQCGDDRLCLGCRRGPVGHGVRAEVRAQHTQRQPSGGLSDEAQLAHLLLRR